MSYGRKEDKDYIIFTEEPAQNASAQNGSLEDSSSEAYDPETGEINWDCPCLGPMVQPPCGDKFKEAFSCFVYSTEEPKGSDCIEQFREMQKCFQAHPEIYGTDDDEDIENEKGEEPK